MPLRLRRRLAFVALAFVTIALGLLVHLGGAALQSDVRDVLGDAFWAVMIVWAVSVVVPSTTLASRGVVALAICWAVEASQLYHAPGLDALRATTVGHLVLGSGFDPRDFVAYAIGVLAAALLEQA